MAFEIGQRVGDYEILQMLGAGGMGHVYRVRNVISDRVEAMKVLLPDLAAEPDLAVRFISEIRTLASFDHPNIAQLHTAFQADNQLVMMMEFVEGFTLEHRGQSPMAGGDIVQYISQTLSALSYAHARGVVHRDIKPANIMVTSHGIAKLMDFGIAKSTVDNNLTRPGTTMGSLYYMSPEQVRGTTVDARSDLYSVGIVLYELLAGHRPFEADTTFSILNQQLNVQPRPPIEVNPSLPPGLNDIILTALAKDPAQRFQSADAFRNALKPFAFNPKGELAEHAGAAAVGIAATGIAAAPAPSSYQPTPPPSYQPVPPPSAPAPLQYKQPRSSSNKPLWIATGAVAAVLALVAVGLVVPRYMHTHAASATTDASNTPPSANVTSTPTAAPDPTPAATGTLLPSASPTAPGSPTPAPGGSAKSTGSGKSAPFHDDHPGQMLQSDGTYASNNPGGNPGNSGSPQPQPAQPAADNSAELSKLQDEFVQLNARASSAHSGVARIRSQQEKMGVGMRGDIASADSSLDSYLRSADNELRGGDTAAANRDMEKANRQLGILEKFLGQ
jgi:eukaryotic-like serine/threonine-protein kinase